MFKKPIILAMFLATIALVTSCGGDKNASNSEHPEFSWYLVAVSNNYYPSGEIDDLTPTFSWKAIDNATEYQFGHGGVDGTESPWTEYSISAEEAGCASESQCNYKPLNHVFNEGEQIAWWVRGKTSNGWADWSSAYVFNIAGDSNGSTGSNTIKPKAISPTDGETVGSRPTFSWGTISGAKNMVFGFERLDGTNWHSFTVDASSSFRPDESIPSGDYTWWMRAEMKDGSWTNWSDSAYFTVESNGYSDSVEPPTNLELGRNECSLRGCFQIRTHPNMIAISWQASATDAVDYYEVNRQPPSGDDVIATIYPGEADYQNTQYVDSDGIELNTTYTYYVTAFKDGVSSASSNYLEVTTPDEDTTAPEAPALSTVAIEGPSGQRRAVIRWSNMGGGSQVNIYRDGELTGEKQTYRSPKIHTEYLGDVPSGTTYTYTSTAVDKAGNESDFSNEVTVTVP